MSRTISSTKSTALRTAKLLTLNGDLDLRVIPSHTRERTSVITAIARLNGCVRPYLFTTARSSTRPRRLYVPNIKIGHGRATRRSGGSRVSNIGPSASQALCHSRQFWLSFQQFDYVLCYFLEMHS